MDFTALACKCWVQGQAFCVACLFIRVRPGRIILSLGIRLNGGAASSGNVSFSVCKTALSVSFRDI